MQATITRHRRSLSRTRAWGMAILAVRLAMWTCAKFDPTSF